MAAADAAKKATGALGFAWKAAKVTAMSAAVFSAISLTGGSAAMAAVASGQIAPGLGALAGIPIEGVGEAAQGISDSVSWATGHLQGYTASAAQQAATLSP